MGRFSQLETTGEPKPPETAPAAAPSALEGAAATAAPAGPVGGKVVRPLGAGPTEEDGLEHDAAGTMERADAAFYTGEWDKSLRLYSRVIQMDSALVLPWVGQVYALLRKKQFSEAMTWVNRALELFPEHPSLLSARGVVYAAQGMTTRAVGASDYALSKGGTREAWLARGEILLAAGNSNAIACFDKALEQSDENDWKTAMHVGMALFDRKKFGSAYDYLKRAAQNKTTNAYLWHLMGRCAERLRFQEQAIQAYERASHIEPNNQLYKRSLESLHNTGPIKRLFKLLTGG